MTTDGVKAPAAIAHVNQKVQYWRLQGEIGNNVTALATFRTKGRMYSIHGVELSKVFKDRQNHSRSKLLNMRFDLWITRTRRSPLQKHLKLPIMSQGFNGEVDGPFETDFHRTCRQFDFSERQEWVEF